MFGIKQETFTERKLNYWTYCFTYDKTWLDTFGQCEYGYNSFIEVYKAIEEDKKINKEMQKAIDEPQCYYHALFYEWNEEDNCYYYREYEIKHRRRKNGKIHIWGVEL